MDNFDDMDFTDINTFIEEFERKEVNAYDLDADLNEILDDIEADDDDQKDTQ